MVASIDSIQSNRPNVHLWIIILIVSSVYKFVSVFGHVHKMKNLNMKKVFMFLQNVQPSESKSFLCCFLGMTQVIVLGQFIRKAKKLHNKLTFSVTCCCSRNTDHALSSHSGHSGDFHFLLTVRISNQLDLWWIGSHHFSHTFYQARTNGGWVHNESELDC